MYATVYIRGSHKELFDIQLSLCNLIKTLKKTYILIWFNLWSHIAPSLVHMSTVIIGAIVNFVFYIVDLVLSLKSL